jgi:hypothetical protein
MDSFHWIALLRETFTCSSEWKEHCLDFISLYKECDIIFTRIILTSLKHFPVHILCFTLKRQVVWLKEQWHWKICTLLLRDTSHVHLPLIQCIPKLALQTLKDFSFWIDFISIVLNVSFCSTFKALYFLSQSTFYFTISTTINPISHSVNWRW